MDKSVSTGPGNMVVEEWGAGPRVVFVHGGGEGGSAAWEAQRPLAAHWRLVMPARPGYGESPWPGNEDFERDAGLIAEMLRPGDHLVAHSYGAAVAVLAASADVSKLASLTLIESGTSDIAKDDPRVTVFHYAQTGLEADPPADDEEMLRMLFRIIQPGTPLPKVLPPPLRVFAKHLRTFRFPSHAVVPEKVLRDARFKKLLVSGGSSPAFEAITDRLAERLGGERVVIPNGGHAPQKAAAPAFNAVLSRLLAA